MDNGIDQMQKTAKTIMLFDVKEFTPQMKEMARYDREVRQSWCRKRVPLLSAISAKRSSISDLTAQISALEGRADELHDIGLKALYQANVGKADPMAFYRRQ